MRYLIAVAMLLTAGCESVPAPAAARVGPEPDLAIPLLSDSDVPLEWSGVAKRGDTLFVSSAKGPEVWQIPLDSGAPTILFDDKRSGLAIAGMALRGRDIGLFRRNGDFSVLDERGDTRLRHISPENALTKPLAVAAGSDHWLTGSLVTSLTPGTSDRHARMIVQRIDEHGTAYKVFEELHWSNNGFWTRAFDLRGVTFSGDSALVTGIEPPRIVVYAIRTGATDTLVLQDTPERPMATKEREDLERSLREIPEQFRKQLVLPRFQPPVVNAWPFGAGILVLAYGPEEQPILDWYCDGRFQRTLIEDPALTEMFRVGDEIITVGEGTGRDYELRLYRIANLRTDCP